MTVSPPCQRMIRSGGGVISFRHFRKVSRPRISKPGAAHSSFPAAHGGMDRAEPALVARKALMTESPLMAAAGDAATARWRSSGAQLSSAEKIGLFDDVALCARTMRLVGPVRRSVMMIQTVWPHGLVAVRACIRP